MRHVILALAAAFALAPAARAEDLLTYPQRDFGAWSVYGFQGDCWMVNDHVDGASVSFSTNPRDTNLYIAVANPAWTGIAQDARLDVRLSFDGFDAVRAASGLPVRGRGFSLFLQGPGDTHLAALRTAARLQVAAGGIALEVPFADARPAFDYMHQCTEDIRK